MRYARIFLVWFSLTLGIFTIYLLIRLFLFSAPRRWWLPRCWTCWGRRSSSSGRWEGSLPSWTWGPSWPRQGRGWWASPCPRSSPRSPPRHNTENSHNNSHNTENKYLKYFMELLARQLQNKSGRNMILFKAIVNIKTLLRIVKWVNLQSNHVNSTEESQKRLKTDSDWYQKDQTYESY